MQSFTASLPAKHAGKVQHASSRSCQVRVSTATNAATINEDRRKTVEEENRKRVQAFQSIVKEASELAIASGPKGVFRALQAGRGVFELLREQAAQSRYDPPQVLLRKLFEKLGATYVKLGQFIASSPSLFPEEYVLEFQKCLDRTDPVPFDAIKRTIEEDLRQPVSSLFSYIDSKPLASASVAQVHAAVLRDSNKEVVIKVLKPGVEEVLTTDLNFLYISSKLLELINPELSRLSLADIVTDIRCSMMDEVDFVKEARNINDFSSYLERSGMRAFATCPFVYDNYSSRRVLTMERLSGVPLTDLNAIRSITTANPEQTLINALNTWFGSVLACDTFHADVHAGNLLVLPDGRVGFIDFGIVGRISPVTWRAIEALATSTATNDFTTMARALATMGATGQDVDIAAFARDLEALFKDIQEIDSQLVVQTQRSGGASSVATSVVFDETQINKLVIRLSQIAQQHGVRIPREFGLLLKQLLYFDRYVRVLAPQLSILTDDRIKIASKSAAAYRPTRFAS